MKQKIYQIDAFSQDTFKGNPAAVCVLEQWLSEEKMQAIAMENNLSETAFVVPMGDEYEIRWFTPLVEVDLCGHATLASAHVLFEYYNHKGKEIVFQSRNKGTLKVVKEKKLGLVLNFPAQQIVPIQGQESINNALGATPVKTIKGETDFMLVFENETQIKSIRPNFTELAKTKARGIIVTAPGSEVDFVSRFFGPACGVNEDPVTGSAHTILAPFWAETLGKKKLKAQQISKRGGALHCEIKEDRVLIAGHAVTYMEGEINL
jgi:PhzF family phenazine biosynthesis protein